MPCFHLRAENIWKLFGFFGHRSTIKREKDEKTKITNNNINVPLGIKSCFHAYNYLRRTRLRLRAREKITKRNEMDAVKQWYIHNIRKYVCVEQTVEKSKHSFFPSTYVSVSFTKDSNRTDCIVSTTMYRCASEYDYWIITKSL